jgi:transcriptional regulator with XRE-family HTH domain
MEEMLTDDDVRVNVAANLKRLLAEREISQSQLARLTGDTQANISHICAGRHVAGAAVLARIADALDTSIDFLVAPPKKVLANAS